MEEYMHSMERARAFSIGTLADEVEFSIAEYKKGVEEVTEKETTSLLAAKEFLENILNFEKNEMVHNGSRNRMGALPKIELLEDSGSMVRAWIRSKISLPNNDEEFEQELLKFINTLKGMAEKKSINSLGKVEVNNVEKLFSTLGEMALRKVHVSSLHDSR